MLQAVVVHPRPRTIELALLASADDPAVAPIPRRVTQRRRGYLARPAWSGLSSPVADRDGAIRPGE